ncbi:TetR/AcrR family transcriptional regulator [Streptomyces sp. GQFP]|uniref:TetR/AcrR family transcriptional regulator n=1 Tax=Streptomyces sp. GQFP TaxID=2907545 RepID=UPI001F3B03B8|nr:TetR family transcriptional regulator [Streptomyces sp. GQFP]UIX29158.1 TetR family transcriptional regulator [Streptomyces sp. GQFP]
MSSAVGEPVHGANSTRGKLVAAALTAFCAASFDGVSVRNIERQAGVERGLVAYHFGSKQNLWNEAVDSVFNPYYEEMTSLSEALRDVSPGERGRALTMAYVRFNARHPELFKLLVLEGLTRTERTERLESHLRRARVLFHGMIGLPESHDIDQLIQVYLVLGAAGTPFALSAYREPALGGPVRDDGSVYDPAFVERFARAVAEIAVPRVHNRDEWTTHGQPDSSWPEPAADHRG